MCCSNYVTQDNVTELLNLAGSGANKDPVVELVWWKKSPLGLVNCLVTVRTDSSHRSFKLPVSKDRFLVLWCN